MSRAERRRRTRIVAMRRHRQWEDLYGEPLEGERRRGKCRDRSPFDCGNTNCGICRSYRNTGKGPRSVPPLEPMNA